MPNQIALYNADGHLLEWIDQRRFERLQGVGMISRVVRRGNKAVCRAYLFARKGEGRALDAHDYLGTRYSYRERLDDGHRAWTLRKLGDGDDVRQAFQQVRNECTVA